jgi:hypothetical protein
LALAAGATLIEIDASFDLVDLLLALGRGVGMHPANNYNLLEETRQLREELGVACRLIQLLALRLQAIGGNETLGPELTRVVESFDAREPQGLMDQIGALAKNKQDSKSVRQLRELLGCTWDEAFETLDQWGSLNANQKFGVLYFRQARRALKSALKQTTPQVANP